MLDGQSVTLNGLKWTKVDGGGLKNETFRFTLSARRQRAIGISLQKWAVEIGETLSYKAEMTGADIKKLREALGLSQRKFAKILEVSNMTISRAEVEGPSRALVLIIERAQATGLLRLSDKKIKPE